MTLDDRLKDAFTARAATATASPEAWDRICSWTKSNRRIRLSRAVAAAVDLQPRSHRRRLATMLTAGIVTVSVGVLVTTAALRSADSGHANAARGKPGRIDGPPCPASVPSRTNLLGSTTASSQGGRGSLITGKPNRLTICQYSAAVGGELLFIDVPYSPDNTSRPAIGQAQDAINQHTMIPASAPTDCVGTDSRLATLALFQDDDGRIQTVLILRGEGCHELVAPSRLVVAAGSAPLLPWTGTEPSGPFSVPTPEVTLPSQYPSTTG
jgi:hypothetical protein